MSRKSLLVVEDEVLVVAQGGAEVVETIAQRRNAREAVEHLLDEAHRLASLRTLRIARRNA